MKHLGKLAVLGAVFAACGPLASASPILLTGTLETTGGAVNNTPAIFSATSTSAVLGTPLTEPGILTSPAPTGSLADFVAGGGFTITDDSFSTAAITAAGPAGLLVLSVKNNGALSVSNPAGGDTLNFYATSFGNFTPSGISTEGAVDLFGYYSDGGAFSQSAGELDFSANGLGNNFTEDLIATAPAPEPSSLLLLGTGLLGGAGMLMRRRKAI